MKIPLRINGTPENQAKRVLIVGAGMNAICIHSCAHLGVNLALGNKITRANALVCLGKQYYNGRHLFCICEQATYHEPSRVGWLRAVLRLAIYTQISLIQPC